MGDWAKRLAAKPLPALRDTHARLSRLVGRDDTTHWQIEDVLRRDPALALAVLGETNRQARRLRREEVTTFDSAIGLLGRERLKQIIRNLPELCTSLLDPLPKAGYLTVLARSLGAVDARSLAYPTRGALRGRPVARPAPPVRPGPDSRGLSSVQRHAYHGS